MSGGLRSTTSEARRMYADRKLAAKWVLAKLYLNQRGLTPYRYMPMALRIVNSCVH